MERSFPARCGIGATDHLRSPLISFHNRNLSGMGITLWIVPPSACAAKLRRIMNVRPGPPATSISSSSYPRFHPHITLLSLPADSPISVSALRDAISSIQQSLDITFKSIDIGTHFFRSVYIAVQLTPELTEIHTHVHKKVGVEPRTPKYPHVSLCYITDEDAQHGERRAFYQAIESKIRKEGDGGSLDCGELTEEWISGFVASEIWIAECNGPIEDWKILDKIPLH
ncbi:2',3'-cyclic-nucleotide 3'-phosphodiesterase [Desarmillaria tabescens]|uniref:2',3'-cyclic-nucleotide 3'-phosphodiesterase n=1 Tax=Armillaria tabescens TaxID=1929756 RepID=A0AA39NDU3_ARMTA|nr:2',3'-cyclic-nucleotide 3'-phosphodiesterase [Desarmillaria tabescens]KAK0463776.1 2',3'-cyclic-nucleotide 3'-phosphodiesterase [Desarmillaria tabescens]